MICGFLLLPQKPSEKIRVLRKSLFKIYGMINYYRLYIDKFNIIRIFTHNDIIISVSVIGDSINMIQSVPENIAEWCEIELEVFIKNNSSLFFAFAFRYIKNQEEIEDLIQDCYLTLWNDRKKIGRVESPINYMFTMIKNRAINRLKRKSKIDIGIKEDISDQTDFCNNIIEVESSKIIADAVKLLSPQSQVVVNLLIQGFSLDEISKKLSISINSVKTIKYRAIDKLAKKLPRYLFIKLFLY